MGMLQLVAQRAMTKIVLVLILGVTAGLIVGGAIRIFGPDSGGAHAAAPRTSATPTGVPAPPLPTAEAGPLRQGRVPVNDSVGDLTTEVALGTVHTPDGAVAAFAAYAAWLVGSPAAQGDPTAAIGAVGGGSVNPIDARLISEMTRQPGDGFAASAGGYRVLGHAGDAKQPQEVMVEVTAPLTVNGRTRWSTIGGVVTWTPDGWKLVSIRPVEVPQPEAGRRDIRQLSTAERARTFAGLGWQAFALPEGR